MLRCILCLIVFLLFWHPISSFFPVRVNFAPQSASLFRRSLGSSDPPFSDSPSSWMRYDENWVPNHKGYVSRRVAGGVETMVPEVADGKDLSKIPTTEKTEPYPGYLAYVRGRVMHLDRKGAFIDINRKLPAFLPNEQISRRFPVEHPDQIYRVGQIITAQVIGRIKSRLLLSTKNTLDTEVWQEIERQFRNDDIVTASVLETTKDGIKVLIHDTMAAFVPGSHIVGTITKDNVGQSVQVKYLNVRKEGIVMSMRRALADLVKVSQGMVLTGKVTSILHFGVVVEILGGVKGFLHISQISNALVKNLESHFQVGQDIKVMVTEVSPDLSKLLFSTRILEKSPGELVECFEELQNSAEERGKAFRDRRQLEKQAQSRVAQDLITFLTSK